MVKHRKKTCEFCGELTDRYLKVESYSKPKEIFIMCEDCLFRLKLHGRKLKEIQPLTEKKW